MVIGFKVEYTLAILSILSIVYSCVLGPTDNKIPYIYNYCISIYIYNVFIFIYFLSISFFANKLKVGTALNMTPVTSSGLDEMRK